MQRTLMLIALGSTVLSFAREAHANDFDRAACADAQEGDACVRQNGDVATCVPDASDPSVLTCDDEPAGGTGGTGGGGDPACDGLMLGDACTREDGSAGSCVPDVSDPTALDCEDGVGGSSSSSSSSGGDGGGSPGACAELGEGDACVREDGSSGTCVPDSSDPSVLECEDGQNAPAGSGGNAQGDQAACVDHEEGDACTRADGRAGTCSPDDSDPGTLECDDDAAPSSDDSGGNSNDDSPQLSCSFDRAAAPSGLLGLFAIAAIARRRRTAA